MAALITSLGGKSTAHSTSSLDAATAWPPQKLYSISGEDSESIRKYISIFIKISLTLLSEEVGQILLFQTLPFLGRSALG